MAVIVREILNLNILKNAKILAGKNGLDNQVQYVDVIEVPDFNQWIKKNTLFLTTAFATHNDEEKLYDLVKCLGEGKAGFLGIKLGRYVDVIPQKVLKLADTLNLPIVSIPVDIAYSEIINSVLNLILQKQADLLRLGDELHQRLQNMVLSGKGLQGVVDTLQEVIKKPVFIEHQTGDLLAYSASEEEKEMYLKLKDQRFIVSLREDFEEKKVLLIKNSLVNQVVSPILAGSKKYGMLVILENNKEVTDFIKIAIQKSATVAALEIMKEKAVVETEIRLQRDFIDELLKKDYLDEYSLIKRANDFSWDIKKEFIIMNCFIEYQRKSIIELIPDNCLEDIKTDIYNSIKKVVIAKNENSIITQRGEGFLVFLDISNCNTENVKGYTENLAQDVKDYVENNFSCLFSIGIGRPVNKISRFSKGFEEANQALVIGKRALGKGKIYNFEDMGVYRILFSVEDNKSLQEFYLEYLEPLVQYDQKNNTELVSTLEKYYKCNANVLVTAEKLFMHRNTLNYRLKRIRQILNTDIDEPEIKMCLFLALKIKRFLNV